MTFHSNSRILNAPGCFGPPEGYQEDMAAYHGYPYAGSYSKLDEYITVPPKQTYIGRFARIVQVCTEDWECLTHRRQRNPNWYPMSATTISTATYPIYDTSSTSATWTNTSIAIGSSSTSTTSDSIAIGYGGTYYTNK